MTFESPLLLLLVPAVAGTIAGLAWWARRVRLRLAHGWSHRLGEIAATRGRRTVPWFGLLGGVIAVGLAGPRGGLFEQEAASRALNLVLAVDISRSMLAEDVAPNRLGLAIQLARRLGQDLPNDRLGLLGFAGHSYVLAPLTLDHAAIDLYLNALDPDLASEGGTHLSAVLQQGYQILRGAGDGGDRVLVLLTDGEAHDSLTESVAAARRLKDDGVLVVVVGIGGSRPVRIPLRERSGQLSGYHVTPDGDIVQTARQDGTLRRVAQAAGGVYISADVANPSGAVAEVVGDLGRSPVTERRLRDRRPLAWIAGLLAGLMLLGHTVARRGASLVALATVAAVGSLQAQRPSRGVSPSRSGDFDRAESGFRQEAERAGPGTRDTAWYNAGTAALNAGRYADARQALKQAAGSTDPDLRFRALYNIGVAALLEGRAVEAARDSLDRVAATALKEALLLRPDADRAKWNLELAMRNWRPPPPPSGGGASPPPRPNPAERDDPRPESGGLSPAEAEAILSSVERGEAATRADQARRRRAAASRVVKDW